MQSLHLLQIFLFILTIYFYIIFFIYIFNFFNVRASITMPLHPYFTQNFLIKKKENSLLNFNCFNKSNCISFKIYSKSSNSSFSFNEILLILFTITISRIKLKMSWFFGNKNLCLSEASLIFVFKKCLDKPGLQRGWRLFPFAL